MKHILFPRSLFLGGLGYSNSQTSRISVLSNFYLFHVPTLTWLPCISPDSPTSLDPTPRFAVLTSISSSHLIVAGGQTLSGETLLETNVFDLKRKAWIAKKEDLGGITGAYGWSSSMLKAKSWSVKSDETQEGLTFSYEEEFGGEVFCWTSAGVSSPLDQLTVSKISYHPPLFLYRSIFVASSRAPFARDHQLVVPLQLLPRPLN